MVLCMVSFLNPGGIGFEDRIPCALLWSSYDSISWTPRCNISHRTGNQREAAQATKLHQQCLEVVRESGDQWGLAGMLGSQGIAAFNLQRFADAERFLTEALVIFNELGDDWSIMFANTHLGLTLVQQGKYQ